MAQTTLCAALGGLLLLAAAVNTLWMFYRMNARTLWLMSRVVLHPEDFSVLVKGAGSDQHLKSVQTKDERMDREPGSARTPGADAGLPEPESLTTAGAVPQVPPAGFADLEMRTRRVS